MIGIILYLNQIIVKCKKRTTKITKFKFLLRVKYKISKYSLSNSILLTNSPISYSMQYSYRNTDSCKHV